MKEKKAIKEYLQSISKDRVVELCLQFMFDVEVTEQQLSEKDKLLKCYQEEEKLIAEILGDKDLTLIGSRVHLENLVVELKNKIKDRDIIIEEKDKEIEEKMMSFEKRCQEYYKSDEFKRDFAIQELEKVKDFILENTMLETETAAVLSYVLRQIKELSNNTFKCEICGEITPKECEGGEPNVCADCVPT